MLVVGGTAANVGKGVVSIGEGGAGGAQRAQGGAGGEASIARSDAPSVVVALMETQQVPQAESARVGTLKAWDAGGAQLSPSAEALGAELAASGPWKPLWGSKTGSVNADNHYQPISQ